MKKETGITLIALVITIIVLLILAGVSISMVAGDNGIASKAADAKEKTRAGDMQDIIDLAVSENQMVDYSEDASKTTKEELIEKFVEEGKLSKEEAETLEGQDTIEIGGVIVDFSKLPGPSLASQIDESNYGDYVNYSKDLGLTLNLEGETEVPKTDWRIFYKEGERVYLIAADYVPNTSTLLKTTEAGMSTNGTYSLYWNSAPSALATGARQDSLFGITSNSYALNESNANSKCVSELLDTSNWSNFVDTRVADFAIGGPTIEMYTNSWNAKGYTTITPTSESTATGYKVNGATHVDVSSDTNGYGNNLYYPHKKSSDIGTEGCLGYWLAAPSALGAGCVMYVDCIGVMDNCAYSGNLDGVRPVVSLTSGITAEKDANGIWQLDAVN